MTARLEHATDMGSPILDYAGPTSRSALRLAAQSELHVTAAPPDRRLVRETLAGQVGPIGAIVPELELRMWSGPPVRLFTGHRQSQLAYFAQTIRAIQPPLPATG